MLSQTNFNLFKRENSDSTYDSVMGNNQYHPLQKNIESSTYETSSIDRESSYNENKIFEPPVVSKPQHISVDSTPLEIWEGVVREVNNEDASMTVHLDAKMGTIKPHTAEIDMEWVSDQDKGLVQPGAVFYLTLFKRTKKGGTIENSQELRFRRLPSWSEIDLKNINKKRADLHSKMTALPMAE